MDAIQEDILNQEQKDKEKEALERIERGEELESQDGNTQEEDQNDDRYQNDLETVMEGNETNLMTDEKALKGSV